MFLRVLFCSFVFGFILVFGSGKTLNQAKAYQDPTKAFQNELIEQVVSAYGGEKLLNLKSWMIKSKYKVLWPGSYRIPDQIDNRDRLTYDVFDKDRRAGSFEYWEKGYAIDLHSLDIAKEAAEDEEHFSRSYNLINQTYREAPSLRSLQNLITYYTPFLIAQSLKHPDTQILGLKEENLEEKSHWVLELVLPESSNVELFIDPETFLFAKATRNVPGRVQREYFYSDYKTQEGIVTAGKVFLEVHLNYFYSEGFKPENPPVFHYQDIELYERDIVFNQPIDEYLDLPEKSENFGEPPSFSADDFIDQSEMFVTKLSDTVYRVGQGSRGHPPSYSVFVDAGNYIISSGGYPNFRARFEKFKEVTGIDKPLKLHVVTTHHIDHVDGVPEAYDLGASLVTVSEHVNRLKSVLPPEINENRFVLISGSAKVGQNIEKRVEVHEISNGFAKQLLLFYLPEEKIIFLPGHASSPFKEGLPSYSENHETLVSEINRLGLDVDRIIAAQGPRVFTFDELVKSLQEPVPNPCYNDRPICRDIDISTYLPKW